jgi:hypothetical protein
LPLSCGAAAWFLLCHLICFAQQFNLFCPAISFVLQRNGNFMAWLRGLHGMAEGGNGGATPAFWQCRTGAGDGKNALLDETKTAWTCRKTAL